MDEPDPFRQAQIEVEQRREQYWADPTADTALAFARALMHYVHLLRDAPGGAGRLSPD